MNCRYWLGLALAGAMWAQAPANTTDPAAAAAKAAAEEAGAAKTGAQAPPPALARDPQPITTGRQSVPLAQVSDITKMPAGQVVATIDGAKVTAGEVQAILRSLPPAVRDRAIENRQEFYQQYGVTLRLAADAEKNKLPEESPWKQELAATRLRILAQAEMQRKFNSLEISPEDVRKSYEADRERYMQAKVKAIYIPFTTTAASQADPAGKKLLTEDEAKAKAEDLLAKARGGADFGALAKEHSADAESAAKNGDFGVLRKTERLPEAIKTAVFAGKAGEIVGPVRQASGFYLFRIEEIGPQPQKEVEQSIESDLRGARFGQWYTSTMKEIVIQEESLGLKFEQYPAPPKSGPAEPAGTKPSSTPEKK
jgi:parvulin-like peptidyl-prolyl isomerase